MRGRLPLSWVLRLLVCVLVVLTLVGSIGVTGHRPVAAQEGPQVQAAPSRFIIRLNEEYGPRIADVVRSINAIPGVDVTQTFTQVFRGFAAQISPQATTQLLRSPAIASIAPDYVVSASAQEVPTGITRVGAHLNASARAGNGSGSVNADIAVLDTGVAAHSDLNRAGGKDCAGIGSYNDDNGHGTFVAGLAAAKDNGSGIVGAAPGARVWAVKVLDSTGNGLWSYIICGLDWVVASGGIEVVNMSLGGYVGAESGGCASSDLHRAVCRVYSAGVPIVVAAGNQSSDSRYYAPAQYPEVITVSAFADSDGRPGGEGPGTSAGADDTFATFSNYGSPVDIAAPGVDLVSLSHVDDSVVGGYGSFGTSYAAPIVAGGAALIRTQTGVVSPNGVKQRLQQSAQGGVAIPGDPDGSKERMASFAFLGAGVVTSVSGAKPGDVVPVQVANFAPGSRVSIKWDGVTKARVTVGDDGTTSYLLTVPISPRGAHTIEATNSGKRDTTTFRVRPRISLSQRSGFVDDSVRVTLRGWTPGESILLTFETGNGDRSLVRVTAAASGSAGASFTVPAAQNGGKLVKATGNRGNSTSTTFTVKAIVTGELIDSNRVVVQLRGWGPGEQVTLTWDDPEEELTVTTASTTTGSKNVTITIPPGSPAGSHTITAAGNQGHSDTGIVSQPTAAELQTPSPTATATTETPTEAPTELPTDIPTETSTELPTETPTETPAEIPTEAATEVPTETPTEAPTETPTPTEEVPTDTGSDE